MLLTARSIWMNRLTSTVPGSVRQALLLLLRSYWLRQNLWRLQPGLFPDSDRSASQTKMAKQTKFTEQFQSYEMIAIYNMKYDGLESRTGQSHLNQ
jgi:hypothetical protein